MSKTINFVTTNTHKFEVARNTIDRLSNGELELAHYDIETPEIQDESEAEIARNSALWVSRKIGGLAVSSDVGFHINSLGGFPGPFVKYANKWLQPNDILNMLREHDDRTAFFVDALALALPDGECHTFVSKTQGVIIDTNEVPDIKWTMDAIFVPDGHSKVLAEMSEGEEQAVWGDEPWLQLTKYLIKREANDQ